MVRKTIISVSIVGLIAVSLPWRAYSLGLGEIKLNSALNQPLQAEIRLHAVREVSLKDIQVSLAPHEEFVQVGIEPALMLSNLRFRPERKESGETVVEITSQDSIRDPFLEFLVTVTWPQGRLSRAYTLLLDPPPLSLEAESSLGKARAISLLMPEEEEVTARSDRKKVAAFKAADIVPATYGPVTPADTLWPLAQRLRPKPSILPQQMMLALLRANLDAFLHNNLNGLIVGRVLKVPPEEEVLKISPEEAIQEVQRQNEAWAALLEKGRVRGGEAKAAKAGDQEEEVVLDNGSGKENAAVAVRGQNHRQEDTVPAVKTMDDKQSPDVERLLALVHEALEVRAQESKVLQSRLHELEQEMGALQEHASKKDAAPAPLSERLTAAKEREGVLSKQRLVPPPWQEDRGGAAEELKAPADPGDALPLAETGEEEVNRLQGVYGILVERKGLLLLGGGGILLLVLIVLQVRRRKANEEPVLLKVAEPAQGAVIEIPAEVLNRVPIAFQPGRAEVEEAGEAAGGLVCFQGKTQDVPLSGDILSKQEAGALAAAKARGAFPYAEEVAEGQEPEAVSVELLEFDLGEITSSDQNAFAEEDAVKPGGFSDKGEEGDGLEFDLVDELSLEESMLEMQRPETEVSELEFDLGEITAFSHSDPTEEAEVEPDSPEEKEAMLEAEMPVVEVVERAGRDSDVEDYRPPRESSGQALMNDLDEMEIKLGLAQAYIEMGSPQDARGALEEVISAGNQRQRGMGQELLTKLTRAS